jgi:pyrroline-5-carboxylate reductase
MTRLVLIGGGRMGEALLSGLIRSGWAPATDLAVVEPVANRRAVLQEQFPDLLVSDSLVEAEGAVIAVKPAAVAEVCRALDGFGGGPPARVLSIAAGVTLATLEGALPAGVAAVRAMPNTPALVGAGAAAIAGGSTATEADLDWAAGILAAVGSVARVPEHLLDAVTGLSGSGPAYVFLVAEALIDAGVLVGLPRPIAVELATQTLLGSARLLTESGDSPAELRAAVTSPGGTTAAGLRALEDAGVRAAFLSAVAAATQRAHELG